MVTSEIQKSREMFMAIATVEHHFSSLYNFSAYDLCEAFSVVWASVEKRALSKDLTLDSGSVMKIGAELAKLLCIAEGHFLNKEKWQTLIDDCGGAIDEDPGHVMSWIFSALYWDHLSQLRLVTTWLYVNGLRVQKNLPIYCLPLNNLGLFLNNLSGSGPPIYDGQTFYPDSYS